MRLLLDSCVWGKAKEELIAAGHDVVWVRALTAAFLVVRLFRPAVNLVDGVRATSEELGRESLRIAVKAVLACGLRLLPLGIGTAGAFMK